MIEFIAGLGVIFFACLYAFKSYLRAMRRLSEQRQLKMAYLKGRKAA